MDKICYIVGAGELTESFKPSARDLVIAADGGYDHIVKMGITPDVLIGDMDSLSLAPSDVEVIKVPVEKDETDMLLAYRLGCERGYREFVIYGGTGGRTDHTLANYALLLHARKEGNRAYLVGSGARAHVIINESVDIFGTNGGGVSAFAQFGNAYGVSVEGLKYEARDITLTPEFPLCVSNSHTENGKGTVSVRDGALLIIEEL